MSSGFAISGVTALLQYNLGNAYLNSTSPFSNPPTISCLAPDQVQSAFGGGSQAENQVNLFLHQVTHNSGWRNIGLPSLGADGRTPLKNPPLALDLHYLLTVYGSDTWQAEALLGFAVLALHETPVFARGEIANTFANLFASPPPNTGGLEKFLPSSGLADQIEMIKITPSTLGREEMAWLWTALKADYRPTYPFQVTVVLIEPQQPMSLPLPVLRRHVQVQPIQPAQILKITPGGEIGATPGQTVVVSGEFLGAVTQAALANARLGIFATLPATQVTNASFSFVLNSVPALPAGIYDLSGQITDATGAVLQSTNVAQIALAPNLPSQGAVVSVGPAGHSVQVTFTPAALERQTISLALSTLGPITLANPYFSLSAPLTQPISGSASTCAFLFPSSLPTGSLLGRLIVDAVPSPVQVDWTTHPPKFTGPMVTL